MRDKFAVQDYINKLPTDFKIESQISADELNMTLEEYLDFLCEDQFGLTFEEAYECGLVV